MGVEYLGLICGLLLLMLARWRYGRWLVRFEARLVGIMLVLTTLSLLVIDPWLDQLRVSDGAGSSAFMWAHAAASAVYLLLCLLALWLVVRDANASFKAG